MNVKFKFLISSFLSCFLSSCYMMKPAYVPVRMEFPENWHSSLDPGMTNQSQDCSFWWESLNDQILNEMIQQATSQNLDLQILSTRLLQVRAERRGISGNVYPHIDLGANFGNVSYNQKTLNNDLLGLHCKKSSNRKTLNFFEIGFDADWEIDIFGKTAHDIQASKEREGALEESLNDQWITLSAEIARNYVELRGYQLRLELLQQTIHSQQEKITLTEELAENGFVSVIDFDQTKNELNHLMTERPLLELSIHKAIHRLSILLGYWPGELFHRLQNPKILPCLPIQTAIGIPSELLRKRPDIQKAERELAAATESTASAVAALFPRLSLKGFVGSITPSSLFNSKDLVTYIGPQLLLPIFNSKLLLQDVDIHKLKTCEALYHYQKIALEALEEAENAIASLHFAIEHHQSLIQAKISSQEAYVLSLDLYQQGIKDYIFVLINQRAFFSAQDALIQSQVHLLTSYIALQKSIGGYNRLSLD